MSKKIVNLTLSAVTDQIEGILSTYPPESYQRTFSHPSLRQKLTTYVVCRVHNFYTVIEEPSPEADHTPSLCHALEQTLHLDQVIREGIQHLAEEQGPHQEAGPTPTEPTLSTAPSSWFG